MRLLKKAYDKLRKLIGKTVNSFFVRRCRSRLRNNDFSIICCNCIGGAIYNRLGKQFLSPTINLWLTQGDFIKLAIRLKHYLSEPLQFVETDKSYPVAVIDDITIHFNHAKNPEDAARDWYKRRDRVNYENIYLIFYYREGYSIDAIREIEKAEYKNLALLTAVPIDLPYAHFIRERTGRPNGESFLDKDDFGIRTFEKEWDFASWLNEERRYSWAK